MRSRGVRSMSPPYDGRHGEVSSACLGGCPVGFGVSLVSLVSGGLVALVSGWWGAAVSTPCRCSVVVADCAGGALTRQGRLRRPAPPDCCATLDPRASATLSQALTGRLAPAHRYARHHHRTFP